MNAAQPIRPRHRPRLGLIAGRRVAIAAIVAARATAARDPARLGADALKVVTTTTVFADIVRNVGGERVGHSIIPAGVGPEDYEPKPDDAMQLADAELIVSNGVGLDDFLEKLLRGRARDSAHAARPRRRHPDDHGRRRAEPPLLARPEARRSTTCRRSRRPDRARPGTRGRLRRERRGLRTADRGAGRRAGQVAHDPAGEPQARHVPRRVPILRPALRLRAGRGHARRTWARSRPRPSWRPSSTRSGRRVSRRSSARRSSTRSSPRRLPTRRASARRHQPLQRCPRAGAGRHIPRMMRWNVEQIVRVAPMTRRRARPAAVALPSTSRRGYGDRLALTDVGLDVAAGSLLAVIGPNGAGKSTLLKMIAGLLPPFRARSRSSAARPGGRQAGRLPAPGRAVDWGFPVTVGEVVMMGRYPLIGFGRPPGRDDASSGGGPRDGPHGRRPRPPDRGPVGRPAPAGVPGPGARRANPSCTCSTSR